MGHHFRPPGIEPGGLDISDKGDRTQTSTNGFGVGARRFYGRYKTYVRTLDALPYFDY
jgi:hypothetical protein